jgi:hypothetical protein
MTSSIVMRTIVDDTLRTFRASPIFSGYLVATLAVAAIVGLITVNVIDLGMTHFGTAAHRTHDVTYGILFTASVGGILAQLRRPERNVAAMVMALIPPAALLLAGVLASDVDRVVRWNPIRYAAVIIAVVALLHPAGRAFFRSFRLSRISPPMLGLVGLAAVPLIAWASSNIRLQRTVRDGHAAMGHYGFMAAFGFTVIAIGLVASLRPAGWRLTAVVAGLALSTLGATSLLVPDSTSSVDTAWALAMLAWGAAFTAVALLSDTGEGVAPVGATVLGDARGATW